MPAGCRVRTDPDGHVTFASAMVGNGVRTVMAQTGADATGLPLTDVAFDSGATFSVPDRSARRSGWPPTRVVAFSRAARTWWT
ncbi:molybdopterin cofactor-binding domain-containing protein [Mycobacterium sp. URHB0021]|jgi:CO/xanthine dehydrogenase Mo-binding subunit